MRFLPEDIKELEPIIVEIIRRETYSLQKQVDILRADNYSLRKLASSGDDE